MAIVLSSSLLSALMVFDDVGLTSMLSVAAVAPPSATMSCAWLSIYCVSTPRVCFLLQLANYCV